MNVGAVDHRGGDRRPAVLTGQEPRGPQPVVAQRPLRTGEIDVERVGHRAIEQGRRLRHDPPAKLAHGHDVRIVLVQPLFVVRERRDFDHLVSHQVAEQVHGVAAAQQHGAAAGCRGAVHLPGVMRGTDAVPVIDPRVEQLADRPGPQERLKNPRLRVPAEHEADVAFHARPGHRVAEPAVVGHRQGHGLLDQQVLAGLGGGDCLRGVQMAGTANVDDLDPLVPQQAVEVVADRASEP